MNILDTKAGAALVYLVGGAVAIYAGYRLIKALGPRFDPTSDKNLAYTGVNAVGAAVSGNKDFSLGGWFYELTHEEYDPNSGLQTGPKTVRDGARKTDQLWGPIGGVQLRTQ